MKIKLISFILLLFVGVFTYAYEYLEIATIPGTAVLNFQWQQNGNSYETLIDDSEFFLVTGNDDKLFPCYSIYGNGYTDTLWEVYFGYNDNLSYICGDYSLRWVAKLWAWWRFSLDDTDIDDAIDWVTLVNDRYDPLDIGWYYHSEQWDSTWTGQVFSDGNGFFNWNSAKTDFNPYIYTANQINKSTFEIQGGKRADGIDTAIFTLKLVADNGKVIPNFKIKSLKFLTSDSDFIIQDGMNRISTLMFTEDYSDKFTDDNWKLTGTVTSIMPIDGQFEVEVGFFSGDDTITKIVTGNTNFTYPFSYDVVLSDGNGDGKILINDTENVKLVLNNYGNNIAIAPNTLWGAWYLSWYVNDGWYMDSIGTFSHKNIDSTILLGVNIKVYNTNYRIWEKVQLYYDISGKYDITIWWKTYNSIEFNTNTGYGDIYLDKKIDKIETWHELTLSPNGNKVNEFRLQFINDDWYYIHSLYSDLNIIDYWWKLIDWNLVDEKYKTFDINEFTPSYDKWYFVESYDSKTDIDGKLRFGIISYKPVIKGQFDIALTNIKEDADDIYDWDTPNPNRNEITDEFSFFDIVNLDFDWDVVNKWIAVNIANELDIKFDRNSSFVSTGDCWYVLSGTIKGCPDCVFSGSIWTSFTSTSFGTQKENIFIYGSIEPAAVDYYDEKYYYKLNGVKWVKDIILKPNIESSNLRVIWKLIEPKIIGLVSKSWHNTNNITVVNTKLPISVFISRYVKKITEITRWKKETFVSNTSIDLSTITENSKIYKCSNDTTIELSWVYNHSMSLYFKNCKLNIVWDITKSNNDNKLTISLINEGKYKKVDLGYDDGWDVPSNIFIKNTVFTIQAHIFTVWSLFSYKDSIESDNIFTPDRRLDNDFAQQLYIKWKLVSRNTVWWWVTNEFNEVQILGWLTYPKDDTTPFNRNALDVSQWYDIYFWRSSYVLLNTSYYDNNKVSPLIKTKFNCVWDALLDNRVCLTPIVIEYEK